MSANNYRFYKGGRATHPKLMMLSVTEAISFHIFPLSRYKDSNPRLVALLLKLSHD
jgi:hypothetical protein